MALKIYQTADQNSMLMQKAWSSQLNPVLANVLMNGMQLPGSITLVANTPQTINHYLGRQMQGYFVTNKPAKADIWNPEPFNSQTLTLESDADVTINLWVY